MLRTPWLLGVVSYDGLMSTPILATKLYIPPPPPKVVVRSRLIERLDEGLQGRLILVSAPAGFGKTTVVSEWVAGCKRLEPEVRPAWLSLDEGDGDPARWPTSRPLCGRLRLMLGQGCWACSTLPSRHRPNRC